MFSKLASLKSTTAAYVFGTWLMTALLTIIFRSIRVYRRGPIKDILSGIDVYKSDALFLAAGLFLGLALLFSLRDHKKLRTLFLFFTVFLGLIITSIEAIAFRFFGATGSTIDFSLLSYTLRNFAETREVLKSEVPTSLLIVLGLLVLFYLFLPLLVHLGWKKWAKKTTTPPPEKRGLKALLIFGGVGLFCLVLGFFPPFKDPSLSFAQNATLHMLSTGAKDLWADSPRSKNRNIKGNFNTSNIEIEGNPKTNIVVIVLESTRASATSVYNPELRNTPFFEELAKESIVAEKAYTLVPHTSKALTASLCGIPPNLRMPVTEATKGGIPGHCLAKLLSKKGYKTSFFQSATRRFEGRPTLVKNMGYRDFFPSEKFSKKGFEKANYFGREDNIMLKPSLKWIQKNKSKGPLFLTYLTLTPHHNYNAPRRYGFEEYGKGDKQFNRYLNAIHYVDQFTKSVIQMFKDEGLYEDTIFVIYGDHGEGFSEHGRKQHDNVIWEEGTRIPLLIHKAGRFPKGKKVGRIVNQLDIIPTILDLLGLETSKGSFPGLSLLKEDTKRTLFSYCWYDERCLAVREGNSKYIYHFGQRGDEFYDIEKDPKEKNNLIDELKNADQWKEKGLAWRDSVKVVYRQHYQSKIEKFVSDKEPKMEHRVDYKFENYVKLIGYDLKPKGPFAPGRRVKVTTHWKVLKTPPKKYLLFLHGHTQEKKRKNYDHVPVNGFYPVEEWKAGEFISDEYTVQIPYRAQSFYLAVGLYKKPRGRMKVNRDLTEARIDLPLKPRTPKILKTPQKLKIKPSKLKFPHPILPKAPLNRKAIDTTKMKKKTKK